jgi:pyruvate dehydrogenase E1 component alpha subunit
MKKKIVKELYTLLYLIRKTELTVSDIYDTDKIKSPVHLSIGQEAISVGVCKNLFKNDFVSSTYRSHATFLAKGGSLKFFFSELYGKSSGCAGGRGGSMHLVDFKKGIIGSSAVVGSTIPIAAGYALKEKINKSENLVVCFFGDGATEEGCFYETLNFAALKQLPILFVCENNNLAINTILAKRWSKNNLVEKARAFGIKSKKILSNDVVEIYKNAKKIIEYVRSNKSPFLIEIECFRQSEHVGPKIDFNKKYKNKKSKENLFSSSMFKYLNSDEIKKINSECDEKIKKALLFAENSKVPSKKTIDDFVY